MLAGEATSTGLQLGTAAVNGDVFVARLSATGQWGAVGAISHSSGTSNTEALAVDGQGNAVVLGNMPSATTYTFGTRTLVNPAAGRKFVARFNPTALAWDYAQLAPAGGGDGYDFGAAAIDGAGTLTATGILRGTVTFGSTTLTNPAAFGNDTYVAQLASAGLPRLCARPPASRRRPCSRTRWRPAPQPPYACQPRPRLPKYLP